jgi:hypothetical protein
MTMLDPHPTNNRWSPRYRVDATSKGGIAAIIVERKATESRI